MKMGILNAKTWMVASFMCAGIAGAQENYSTWAHYRDISVNTETTGANTSTAVNKFPLLVRLTSADADVFSGAAANGADIRFSKADHVTRVPYQRERYDAVNKVAEFWVLMDTVAAGADNRLRMFWGKSGAADSSNGTEVFDTANGFVGVWHLGDSTTNNPRPDAVVGGPKAVLQNFNTTYYPSGYTPVSGVIGLADTLAGGSDNGNFAGSAPYVDVGRTNYAGFSDFTSGFFYSVWIYEAQQENLERFLEMLDDTSQGNTSANRVILFGNKTASSNELSVRWDATDRYDGTTMNAYMPGAWYQIAFSKPGGSNPMTMFANGVQVEVSGALADLPVAARNFVYMGRSLVTAGDPYYQGKYDEMVMAKKARSADWVKLSYQTQQLGETVVNLGATDTPLIGTAIRGNVSASGFSVLSSGNSFVFRLPANISGARVSVMDIWGRVVWSQTAANGASELSWNAKAAGSSAAPGIYLVRLTAGSGLKSKAVAESKITLIP